VLGLIALALADAPAFGSDLGVGYSLGVLAGEWPEPGPSGGVTVGLGLYPVTHDTPGPRVGGRLWADVGAWPRQQAIEPCDTEPCAPFRFGRALFGLDLSFRSDPARTWGGGLDLGFSRMDIDSWYGGPLVVPMFGVRPGLRRAVGPGWVDLGVRAAWGTSRAADGGLDEWWWTAADLQLGLHLR